MANQNDEDDDGGTNLIFIKRTALHWNKTQKCEERTLKYYLIFDNI